MEWIADASTGMRGVAVALAIGALVRLLRLPIPAPPTIWAALMVVGLTVGYLLMDALLRRI